MKKSQKIQTGALLVIALLLAGNIMYAKKEKPVVKPVVATDYKIANKAPDSVPLNANENAPAKAKKVALPAGPLTTFEFETPEFNFGSVQEGEVVTHTFKFKNTGNEPLIISNAKASCGCTVPSWPKAPIPVGGSEEIVVKFNTKGKKNMQAKKVTITANTNPAQTFITLKGEVLAKAVETMATN